MADETLEKKAGPAAGGAADPQVAALAAKSDAVKPAGVREREWRKYRQAAGNMVVVRSHFKSIFLIPMAIVSLFCGVVMAFGNADNTTLQETIGLIWVVGFCLYMNIFIFEWSRPWTYTLLITIGALIVVGLALNSDEFRVWATLGGWLRALRFTFSQSTYFFFSVFFAVCAGISWLKTRLNYVVIERNEVLLYRNALFGDRKRMAMQNRRVEIKVPDVLEYLHPFYRAGQIIIHSQSGDSIVLDNVLNIRRIERITDRLGSSMSVHVEPS